MGIAKRTRFVGVSSHAKMMVNQNPRSLLLGLMVVATVV